MYHKKCIILICLFSLLVCTAFGKNDVTTNSGHYSAENGRIKLFLKALSIKDTNPFESLTLIVKGICLQSNISSSADAIKDKNIIKTMPGLIQVLSENGYDNDLLSILTPEVVIKTGSAQVLIDTVNIISKNSGYGEAVRFLEKVRLKLKFPDTFEKIKVDKLTTNLFQMYIKQQINYKKLYFAQSIFEYATAEFPSNAGINLDGVEIAVKQGKWREAEQILNLMGYPESYSNRVESLRNQIAELKAQVGKIVIKFAPGSDHIPTQAVINDTYTQNFVIDTGATSVTIPKSAVEALGINIPVNARERRVSTAGAVIRAKEITLKSITLKNKTVHNIKALIVDIPGQPNLGLLGFNFLRHFQVRINNQKGIMLLSPRQY